MPAQRASRLPARTQAHAVYRKLAASSRTEAVHNARHVGLIDA